ncbi:MAG: hypothetical protein Q4P32_00295 [Micrococcales bacterium]|nr:hypothetical protein [Micrococcales bacterium]
MDQFWAIIVAIVPSIGVGFLFYKVMRAIIEGDRNERLAHSRWEAEQDRATAENGDARTDLTRSGDI